MVQNNYTTKSHTKRLVFQYKHKVQQYFIKITQCLPIYKEDKRKYPNTFMTGNTHYRIVGDL